MSLRIKLIAGAFAVSAFAVAGFAQDAPKETPKGGEAKTEKRMKRDGFARHGGRKGGFGLRGIDLTDAQKEQIRQIREANKPSDAGMAEIKAIHEARRSGTALTDEQKARLQASREARRAKMESAHQQIMAVLTPEQKAQLEKQREEMKQRREEMRQRRQELRQKRQTTDTPKTVTQEG